MFIALGVPIAALAALLLVVGPIWEQVERRKAIQEFPARGRLVDIGERRIQIDCRGTGSPIVVFESGLGIDGSMSWVTVHDEVAKFTRACSYSRAGIIWSDDKAGPHDGAGVARDLHATLEAAGENGPFVLVGHSLGGPYITIYTKFYSHQVAGLVYVDAAHPDQYQRFEAAIGRSLRPRWETAYKLAAGISWTGVVRLGASFMSGQPFNYPSDAEKVYKAFASKSLEPALQEMDALTATLAEAGTFRSFGPRPIAVLTGMKPASEKMLKIMRMTRDEDKTIKKTWLNLQIDMASWSSRSTHQILDDANHNIELDRPDAVVAAIRQIVKTVSK